MEYLENLVDLVSLVYHEARNVRYPLKAGKLLGNLKYKAVCNLATDRCKAWRQMQKVRDIALRRRSAAEVVAVFHKHFDLSLEELRSLYGETCWRHSLYGGNKWAPITDAVIALVRFYDAGDYDRYSSLLRNTFRMTHNTGTVQDKLNKLKSDNVDNGC